MRTRWFESAATAAPKCAAANVESVNPGAGAIFFNKRVKEFAPE
jgi:hypothetical protein